MGSDTVTSVREAMLARCSWSKVTDDAPTHDQLVALVAAAGRVADHAGLAPWRLIELRGGDRERLGAAFTEVLGHDGSADKPLRAPLLIAIVSSTTAHPKVPDWEQEAVAAGVGHALSLLLDEAGYGVIWRTGPFTRAEPVARLHGLGDNEKLLGWLYVGGKPDGAPVRRPVDAERCVTRLPD
ncbi:nitroreductase [Gordonia pseudamarae]|jgi:nitroreductase|uniref:Putative NAD(P)H nitroreductase n=1 Tax=Gordonia pseudamarae TaxID=2831662 RepID=A0ABX6ILJ5_9ACTN|nr:MULTISPECIES: nitroreductase family protein [Gordonia]MBD0022753.1 nitroreductase family protein [Gordonia sp. (in: high G+C Gram-positive bacteria)]QHN27355.1 nitroreductase [Gordonia pseudamarae]QHN36239.1 nitroreductase [Gordonia pseudamarae]